MRHTRTHPDRSDGSRFSSLPFSDGNKPAAAAPPQRSEPSTRRHRSRPSRFAGDSLFPDDDGSASRLLSAAANPPSRSESSVRRHRSRPSRFAGDSLFSDYDGSASRLLSDPPSRSESSGRRYRSRPSRFAGDSLFSDGFDFSALPYDVMLKIAAPFSHPELRAASSVCRSWREALGPLREAVTLLKWGKRFKHGRAGVRANLDKALGSFLRGAALGYAPAMVDAGLMYWEGGETEEAMELYRRAAELGDAAGQCNLGISYLLVEPPNRKEAVKWLYKASMAGHIRAQYQLALCLHQDRGVDHNPQQAARWFLKAAEGGYARAMYNTSLSYSYGEGLVKSHRQARKWMARAADRGHSKAQYEHGLSLFIEGDMMNAVVYLELASRAGERAANHVRDIILEQLPLPSRDSIMLLVDGWRALPSR